MLTIICFSFELQRDACSVFVILHNLSCFTRGCLTDALTCFVGACWLSVSVFDA